MPTETPSAQPEVDLSQLESIVDKRLTAVEQAKVAQARGINYVLVEKQSRAKKLRLETFFDNTTMSVHLRENTRAQSHLSAQAIWPAH